MDGTSKLSNRSENIKREKLQYSFVVGKNSQPSMKRGQKYFYIDSTKYVSSFKKHHILPCPQQDSINYIYRKNDHIIVKDLEKEVFYKLNEFNFNSNKPIEKIIFRYGIKILKKTLCFKNYCFFLNNPNEYETFLRNKKKNIFI